MADTDAAEAVQAAIATWRQPWMTEEWLSWWTSLDHSRCTQYADGPNDVETYFALPGYLKCRSMHCPDCGKSCGGQGHMNCPVREAKKEAQS